MSPEDALRQVYAERQARDRATLERVTGHTEARAALADAMSRGGNEEGNEHDD